MTYITISKWGKLAVFRCISLSANPLPHFKIRPSQAALLFESEYQLQVEKHCPSRTSVNQIVVWFFFFPASSLLHLHDTTFPWSHMKQLPWFWSLLQDFPLTGRKDAELTLTDSKQQQEATGKNFFHSEDGQTQQMPRRAVKFLASWILKIKAPSNLTCFKWGFGQDNSLYKFLGSFGAVFFQAGLFHDSKKHASSATFPLLHLNYALLLRSDIETRLASAEASLKGN